MRRILNKLLKKEKQETKALNKEVLQSKEYKALKHLNLIMNLFDEIERVGYGNDDELYIMARGQAHCFMIDVLEKCEKHIKVNTGETTEAV